MPNLVALIIILPGYVTAITKPTFYMQQYKLCKAIHYTIITKEFSSIKYSIIRRMIVEIMTDKVLESVSSPESHDDAVDDAKGRGI